MPSPGRSRLEDAGSRSNCSLVADPEAKSGAARYAGTMPVGLTNLPRWNGFEAVFPVGCAKKRSSQESFDTATRALYTVTRRDH